MKNKRINIFLLVMAAFLTYGGEVAFAQNKSPLKEALKDKFPVSYTHLDVYKRQLLNTLFRTVEHFVSSR